MALLEEFFKAQRTANTLKDVLAVPVPEAMPVAVEFDRMVENPKIANKSFGELFDCHYAIRAPEAEALSPLSQQVLTEAKKANVDLDRFLFNIGVGKFDVVETDTLQQWHMDWPMHFTLACERDRAGRLRTGDYDRTFLAANKIWRIAIFNIGSIAVASFGRLYEKCPPQLYAGFFVHCVDSLMLMGMDGRSTLKEINMALARRRIKDREPVIQYMVDCANEVMQSARRSDLSTAVVFTYAMPHAIPVQYCQPDKIYPAGQVKQRWRISLTARPRV